MRARAQLEDARIPVDDPGVREGAGPGYGERLARLREDGMTMFWAGPWLLLGVAADSRIVEAS